MSYEVADDKIGRVSEFGDYWPIFLDD